MQKYYAQNPMIQGVGQFLAGFGQMRQQVHTAENMAEDRNTQQLYSGIGQGVGGGVQAYAQRSGQLQDQVTAQGYRMAAQQGQQQGAMQLENLRSGNDALQQSMARSSQVDQMLAGFSNRGVQQGGGQPGMGGGAQPIGTNMDGSSMMPEQTQQQPPQSPGLPLPSIDPSMTQAYQKADQAISDLTMKRRELYAGSLPPMEKAAAVYQVDAELMRNAQVRGRYQQPKPPATFEEMSAAGVHGGGITVAPDGSWLVPKGITRSLPAKSVLVDGVDVSWPDGTTTKSTPGSHSRILPEYGLVTVDVDTNGNTQTKVTQPIGAKGGGGKGDLDEISGDYDSMAKAMKPTDQKTMPTPNEVVPQLKQRDAGIKQAMIELKGLQPMVNELGDLVRKSQSLAQNGETDMELEQRIGALRKQLNEAMREN